MRQLLDARLTFWMLLALPSVPMCLALGTGTPAEALLHPTGEFAARFMIIAMMLTPLRLLFPTSGFLLWLMRRRRYLGVAAFAYAVAHTFLYVVDMGSLDAILGEFPILGIWTGWLALFVFLPLAVTSNDVSVRALGARWKTLQRGVYIAALATLVHWMFVHNQPGAALVHFIPLAALEIYRVWRRRVAPARPRGEPNSEQAIKELT